MKDPEIDEVLALTDDKKLKGDPNGPPDQWRFLMIEDVGEVSQALELQDISYRRMSHFEVMTHHGQQEYKNLNTSFHSHLWVTLPGSHFVRATEQKHHSKQSKAITHHARLISYIQLALDIAKPVFVFGVPGHSWTPYFIDTVFVVAA